MWLAHTLTLLRLPLVALMWVWWPSAPVAIALAALTDTLDGRLARRALRSTPPPHPAWWSIGGWLDPLVDKIFVAGAIGAVWFHAHPSLGVLALIAVRELLLVPLVAIYELVTIGRARRPLHAEAIGKAATVAQFFALAAIALGAPWGIVIVLAITCAVLGVITVGYYAAVASR